MRVLDIHLWKILLRHQCVCVAVELQLHGARNIGFIGGAYFLHFVLKLNLENWSGSLNRWLLWLFFPLSGLLSSVPKTVCIIRCWRMTCRNKRRSWPCAHSSVVPYPFGRLFSCPWVISSQSCAYQFSVELLKPSCRSLRSSADCFFPELWLGILAILVSLDSLLCLFNSGSSLGFTRVFPFLYLGPESLSRLTVSWNSCWS